MVDKLLLLLLIILLPVGIVASRQLFQPNLTEDKQLELQTKKVEELISKLNSSLEKRNSTSSKSESEFTITAVTNSSESGVIKISGIAPSAKTSLYYTVLSLPKNKIPELANNQSSHSTMNSQNVETKALRTQTDGTFVLEYPIKSTDGLVEFVLSQEQQQLVIQYDLELNKRVF